MYTAGAVNSEGILAVTDGANKSVHLLTNDGALVRSITKGMFGGRLFGVAFDLRGNVWVTDRGNSKVIKLSQDGQLLQTIRHASSGYDHLKNPHGVAVSPEGLVYICDHFNYRVTVHDEEGMFLFAFGSKRSSSRPFDIAFGSDALVYITEKWKKLVYVWTKDGTFVRTFKTQYGTNYIAATSDNHLLITSLHSRTVMVYTLEGELVHDFKVDSSDPRHSNEPEGICIDGNGLVYIANRLGHHIQVLSVSEQL